MMSSDSASTLVTEFEGTIVPDETNTEEIANTDTTRHSDFADIIQSFQNRSDDILRKYQEKVSAN